MDQESDYVISLDRESGIAVDARRVGNEARFINDYRGVPVEGRARTRGRANAEFRDVWVAVAGVKGRKGSDGRRENEGPGMNGGIMEADGFERRVGVFVASGKRGIARGEEILVSYGKGFWDARRKEDG